MILRTLEAELNKMQEGEVLACRVFLLLKGPLILCNLPKNPDFFGFFKLRWAREKRTIRAKTKEV